MLNEIAPAHVHQHREGSARLAHAHKMNAIFGVPPPPVPTTTTDIIIVCARFARA